MSKFKFSLLCLAGSVCLAVAQQPPPEAPAPAKQTAAPDPSENAKPGEPAPAKDAAVDKAAGVEKVPGVEKAPGLEKLPAPAPGINPNTYVIGPEDVLYVRVWKDNDLSGLVDVRPDGMISLQLIGEIKATGLTPEQLSKLVAEKLLATHKHPEVNIQVVKVLSKKYFIQGEVRRPGSYAFVVPTTLLEALGNAGGFNDFAKTKKIYVLRGTERIRFNFNEVSKGKHMEQNILVKNGDQIFVP